MTAGSAKEKALWRLIVVGGHTRSIGKTQLVCDVIRSFPRTEWIAGKITQYGHGVCAQNGENCDCAPTDHVCALDWETRADTGTDSSRFLEAGAKRSFWLRTKQGYLAEGLPLLRRALAEALSASGENRNQAVIVESNSLMQFAKPSLYFAVIDPLKEDFKESAQLALDRAQALVLRGEVGGDASPAPLWMKLPEQLLREKPSVMQRQGEKLPEPLWELVHRTLDSPPGSAL
jgi:molybdopterin-guanine dinucleotide biosynthesis protein